MRDGKLVKKKEGSNKQIPLSQKEYMEIWEKIVCDKGVRNFVRRFVKAIEERHGIK